MAAASPDVTTMDQECVMAQNSSWGWQGCLAEGHTPCSFGVPPSTRVCKNNSVPVPAPLLRG